MSTLKSDCRKFSPNVFNKSKCQNCFRTKDAHSAEALENNRASRNISKCGYLFVAPDWDFNVSINRTKRWQRRWFKLFDDGELTYALDEFPDTIPQGTIDMNKVLEVSDAESVTGNDFAIAITTPEKVHFVKGTSKEESKWWFDVLSKVLPRQLSRAKHKRNATFPCGKATIPTTAVIAQEYCSEDDMRLTNYEPRPIRPKFLSTSELTTERDKTWMGEGDEDVFPPDDKREVELQNALNKLISQPDEEESDGQTNHQEEKAPKDYLSQLEELDARRRNRRYLKRENRIQRSQRSRVEGVSKMLREAPPPAPNASSSALAASLEKLEYLESINTDDRANTPNSEQGKTSPSVSPKSSSESRQTSLKTNLRKSESLKNIPSETQSEGRDRVSGLRRYHSFKGSSTLRKIKSSNVTPRSKTHSSTLPRSASSSLVTSTPIHQSATPKINLEANKSPSPDITYEHTNDGVFTRTGWLMRQTLSKEWSKHWFVLKDSSLSYYRDPSAEHCGIMDGILDLNQVSTIRETGSDRYCAFSLLMWDGKKHVLAAETEDFRNMWIQALQYASNLWSSASKEDFICSEIVLPEHSFHHSDRGASPPSSLSSYVYGNNLMMDSSTSSSDDQSEYFSLVDEDEVSELSSSPRTLPPSPPVNRTMMSLVKEKSRSRGPKTPAQASGLDFPAEDNDHDAAGRGFYADSAKNTEFKDTSRSLQHSDSFHQLILSDSFHQKNGENHSSTTLANSSTFSQQTDEGENLQFKIEFKNASLKKNDDAVRDSDLRTPIKSIRSECSSTSTPEPETSDECRKCTSVKNKLVAAKEEIRKLKKELKEAHASFDNLEMASYKLAQDIKVKEENYSSQISLMTAKIDDLTSKFSIAEKNYRQLKQKTLKSEGKERKRSSLKSREGLTLTKEYEQKLCDLEKKIAHIETTLLPESIETPETEVKSSGSKTEDVSVPSESSDTSASTEIPSNSSNKGLFSRLQSLGSKVQNFDSMLEKNKAKTIETENPKICLESRDGEVSRDILDMPDDWWATTFNTSIKNLNKYIEDHPTNLSECQNVFVKKVVKIMRWLKNSLDGICKLGNKDVSLTDDKILQLQNLVDIVNATVTSKEPVPSNQSDACYTVWVAFEVIRSLNKLDSVDKIETLVKCDITESAFKVITKTLCIALAEYKNSKLVNVLQLLSDIPQVHYFSPLFSKLFPLSEPVQFDSVSEALQQLNSQSYTIFSSLQEAKEIRYESLWNTLTEIPVQDANTNKPQPVNSILNYATSVATNIHNIAELQLTNSQHQTYHVLLSEQDRVRRWCSETSATLKKSLANFLEELKDQCPMIYESTVSLSDLSNTTRQEISSFITELSFLSVVFSILNRLLRHEEPHENGYMPDFASGELSEHLLSVFSSKSRFLSNSDFFECPQCTVLNKFVTNSSPELDWSDYVLEYNRHKPVKSELLLDFGMDGAKSNSSCTNCDNSNKTSETSTGISSNEGCNNGELSCPECDEWIKKFCASERNHELERQAMELKHNQELQQLEECLIKSSEVHEQEMLQKENELAIATTQLQCLKTEYEAQITTLKNLYEQKLHCDSSKIDEDSIRMSYKIEIEDLKDMFKKGLLAIESSHRRITSEMEKRHKEEIATMKAEKEKALELEARATKTALEVIQKSHDQKLMEETALIREDLLKQFQNKKECEDLFCKYGNDLEKLKTEILTITDLYSAKCLENVALEEKVNSLRRQLEDAHTELCDLLTKNKDINIESNTI